MKRIIPLFFILTFACIVAGCGSGSKPSEAEQQKVIEEQKGSPEMQ